MKPVGLQLYTLRKSFAADAMGTIERIRAAGYDAVEFAAPLDLDVTPLAARMAEIGLDCPSMHAGLDDMNSRPDRVLETARTLGCRYVVLPYVDPAKADWRVVVRQAEAFARLAKAEGFGFCYHHHHFEFDASGGARPFDILIGDSDPALLFLELDVYWLKVAGEDPQAMIERLSGRVKLLHLKDMAPDGKMADVGAGTLDFPALVEAGRRAGVEHVFVEHDFPPEPYWPSVEASLEYLKALE